MLQNDYHKDIAVSIIEKMRALATLLPTFSKMASLDPSESTKVSSLLKTNKEVEEIVEERINQYYKDNNVDKHYNS